MKKNHLYSIILFLCGFSLHASNILSTTPIDKPNSVNQASKKTESELAMLVHMLNNMTFSTLIQVMYDLEDHLTYWQKQLESPRSSILCRLQGWLGPKNTRLVIQEHINELRRVEKIHAHALGSLHKLKKAKNLTLKEYCTKSLEIFNLLISSSDQLPDNPDTEYLLKIFLNAIPQMKNYKKQFDHAIACYKKPSHLARHWWKYLIGITAVCTIGYTAHKYQDTIKRWYHESLATLEEQWQKRIVNPIRGIIKNLSTKNSETNHKDLEEIQAEIAKLTHEIKHTEKILEKRNSAFRQDTWKYYERRPDIPPEEVETYVNRLLAGDDTDLMRDLNEQARHPFANICKDTLQKKIDWLTSWVRSLVPSKQNFHLIESIMQLMNFYKLKVDKKELEMQQIMLETLKIMHQAKQQWYLQEVNTMLGAMFPAALVLYGSYKLSTTAFNSLFFNKIVLIPLQQRILSVRRTLNRYNDGEHKQLPMDALGHLIYWTHKLKQYIVQLPTEHQANYKKDLQELESIQLTTKQKHEVVTRMYSVYDFLQPSYN